MYDLLYKVCTVSIDQHNNTSGFWFYPCWCLELSTCVNSFWWINSVRFSSCWKGGSTRPGVQGQQKLKNVCDLHTLKLAKTAKIWHWLYIKWLKWSKWCSKTYYQMDPKNDIINFGVQRKRWLATSKPME